MNLVSFCGASGSGKTTLMEGVLAALKRRGLRVSVVKHAHKGFDIDQPGKDSWRHRQAGAFEVVVASAHRLAKLRELEGSTPPNLHQLVRELAPCDWVLAEGFKHADVMKIEVLRAALGTQPLYPADPFVAALALDDPRAPPVPTQRPVFSLDDAQGVAEYLLAHAQRFTYRGAEDG